ncbi:MAG: hypothetical protein Roseis2KO_56100 [Roseivirga sp.]
MQIMKTKFSIKQDQLTFSKQVVNHFYLGVIITVFYAAISPQVVEAGYPSITVLLLAELLVLTPIGLSHLYRKGKLLNGRYSLYNVIAFREKLPVKSLIGWSLLGVLGCLVVYAPAYPLGLYLRETLFSWLPEWYFNPGFGTSDTQLIARVLLVGIFIDGLVGPIIEELFFRGYLLPRMSYLKKWAPIVNGVFFGLYHFWQPHNLIGLMAVGIVLSYIVWKKKNVYLGIIIHCSINIIGAISAYLAASNGIIIGR